MMVVSSLAMQRVVTAAVKLSTLRTVSHSRNAGGAGDPFQICTGACRCRETADREQAFVVENDMNQFLGGNAPSC